MATRVPPEAVRLALAVTLVCALLLALTTALVLARAHTRQAHRMAQAREIGWEILATADALDCLEGADAASLARCRAATGDAGSGLGNRQASGSRDGLAYRAGLSVVVTAPGTCPVPAQMSGHRLLSAARSVTVTVTGPGAPAATATLTDIIPVPAAATLAVPARPGQEVAVTTADGTPVRHTANPRGCAVFPSLPYGPARLSDGRQVLIGPGVLP